MWIFNGLNPLKPFRLNKIMILLFNFSTLLLFSLRSLDEYLLFSPLFFSLLLNLYGKQTNFICLLKLESRYRNFKMDEVPKLVSSAENFKIKKVFMKSSKRGNENVDAAETNFYRNATLSRAHNLLYYPRNATLRIA